MAKMMLPGPSGQVLVRPMATSGLPLAVRPFEYQMPVAQTTATFDHNLGRDPTAVQLLVDGQVCTGFDMIVQIPGQRVTIGFDVAVKARIRLL